MENLTGNLGEVEFKDGVSVESVSRMQAQRLRGAFKVETLEGDDPGLAAEITRARNNVESPVKYEQKEAVKEPSAVEYNYTEESLMAIADKDGLVGLREFAEPFGAKSNSIVGLIEKLLRLKVGE